MAIDYSTIAGRYGLPPDVLAALIQQESGGNPRAVGDNGNSFGLGQFNRKGALVDLGLTPEQVLAMPAEQQADLTAKFLATKVQQAGGDLWGGVKRYNGGGDPNYLANVRRRLGGVDVRQASAPGGVSTDTDRTPTGDPMTGLMDMQQTPMPPFPQMAPVEAPPESAPSMLELLALTAAGMAMGGGKGLSGALTGAGLAGGALRQQLTADQELWDLKQKRSDLMRKRQKQSALDEYAQTLSQTPGFEQAGAMMQMSPELGAQYLGTMQTAQQTMALRQQQAAALDAVGRTQEAALVRSGMTPGTVPMKEPGSGEAKYGLQPQLIQMPDGTTVERLYANDGTFLDRPLPGTPARYDPTVAGNVAQAQAGGRTTGESVAKAQLDLPETIATADRSLAVVDTLLNHPGRELAVGWQGMIPPIPGSKQADYIMKLEQLGGANFLQAFEALKGGGQITEVEGAKATKAISDLDRKQSDAEHQKSLRMLKTIFQAARARAAAKAGRPAPEEPVQVEPTLAPGGWKIEKE